MTRVSSLLALLVLSCLLPPRASACSCVQVSPELARDEHAAVFEGRVRSVERTPDGLRVELEVVQGWKGVETERVVVLTRGSSAACGVAFEAETSWLVYADRADGGWQTGLCSRTRRIEQAEDDLAVLGAGVVPVEIGPDDEVEPPAAPPAPRAGCASCAAAPESGLAPRGGWLLLGLVGLRRWRRRAVTRR